MIPVCRGASERLCSSVVVCGVSLHALLASLIPHMYTPFCSHSAAGVQLTPASSVRVSSQTISCLQPISQDCQEWCGCCVCGYTATCPNSVLLTNLSDVVLWLLSYCQKYEYC